MWSSLFTCKFIPFVYIYSSLHSWKKPLYNQPLFHVFRSRDLFYASKWLLDTVWCIFSSNWLILCNIAINMWKEPLWGSISCYRPIGKSYPLLKGHYGGDLAGVHFKYWSACHKLPLYLIWCLYHILSNSYKIVHETAGLLRFWCFLVCTQSAETLA